jgi:hypothetical protein
MANEKKGLKRVRGLRQEEFLSGALDLSEASTEALESIRATLGGATTWNAATGEDFDEEHVSRLTAELNRELERRRLAERDSQGDDEKAP